MRAVTIPVPGGPEALVLAEVDDPVAGPGEVLVEVVATAVNRADLFQRMGLYDPPPGTSPYPGLECSGRIVALGEDVTTWQVGDEVCALLSGGGYAELVAVPAGQLLPVPAGVSLLDAAALPEVACTVWSNLFDVARLRAGETLLVHGGSSGIGTMAIQLATRHGAHVVVTVGSAAKAERARDLGAELAVLYRDEDFVEQVLGHTGGHGADVVLDNMGAAYLSRNLQALAVAGRLVVIGLQGGLTAELDLALLMRKRGAVHATSLRARPLDEKAAVVRGVLQDVWPAVAIGQVRPIVDRVLQLEQAARAHQVLQDSHHIGKVLPQVQ